MKTNSNSYTILAFVFQALRPAQEANVALDKQKQILYSLNIRGLQDQAAAAKYKEVVTADEIIDANGNVVDKGSKGGTAAGFKLNSGDFKAGKLAVYVCSVNGQTKYVIPVYGMGLWGPISGYIALNDDKSTIYGAYFNHESETAGLGAEIKDNQKWQEKFQGKKLFKGDDRNAIAISVLKKRDSNDPNSVDAVTGATLTSNGVTDMLHDCLGQYIKFLNAK